MSIRREDCPVECFYIDYGKAFKGLAVDINERNGWVSIYTQEARRRHGEYVPGFGCFLVPARQAAIIESDLDEYVLEG